MNHEYFNSELIFSPFVYCIKGLDRICAYYHISITFFFFYLQVQICCPLNTEFNLFEKAFDILFFLIQKLQIFIGEDATEKKVSVRNLHLLKYAIAADYLTFPKGIRARWC